MKILYVLFVKNQQLTETRSVLSVKKKMNDSFTLFSIMKLVKDLIYFQFF